MDKQFVDGLSEILEIDPAEITPSLPLTEENWDSLAIVSTIALADEIFNVMLDGQTLSKSKSIADVVQMIEAAKVKA
jgi:acyl carrier protein